MRVLIADDHAPTVIVCRNQLHAQKMSNLGASTVSEAVSALGEGIDVVAIDADLAGGSVAEFCVRAKKTGAGIILLIPPRFPESLLQPLRTYADAVLQKPFAVETLVQHVQKLINAKLSCVRDYASGPIESYCQAAERPMPDLSGRKIGGCILDKEIGFGSSSVVYLARHELLNNLVAMKLQPINALGLSRIDRVRFVRGAQAAAKVQHPNVVQVLNAGEDGEFFFLAQRYIDGESLKQRLERVGRLPESEVAAMMRQVGNGLAAVHRHGIIHRDIKPSNILIDGVGTFLLADFGLARGSDSEMASTDSAIVGTPLYMSPEQCSGATLDNRSDLYSLGATAYHAIAGCPPIQGASSLAVLQGHVNTVPLSPLEFARNAGGSICRVIMKLLEKSPDRRFASAEEMIAAL